MKVYRSYNENQIAARLVSSADNEHGEELVIMSRIQAYEGHQAQTTANVRVVGNLLRLRLSLSSGSKRSAYSNSPWLPP